MVRQYDKYTNKSSSNNTTTGAGANGLRMPSVPPYRLQQSNDTLQRYVRNDNEKVATIEDVIKFIETANLDDVHLKLPEIERRLSIYNDIEDPVIDIETFLKEIGAIGVEDSKSDDDDEWDPADYAEEPLETDDIVSGEIRKYLRFNSGAKKWMKDDTPQKNGTYICHICGCAIKKGQSVDMDHLPPWKDRLHAFINVEKPTSPDDIQGPDMARLYNMRGSVFAHSKCNRGHSGEGNYKKKWTTAENWYNSNGGPPF
ncbi:hypothetical protein KXQ82_03020 [Mucilaginibacter sp. HMF5004]|uniref:hypothetical protein n=1 Tax=Mucilaginibacter rivuli TaxID=2857527 RepID=UPI001C600D35|nr:hypothetical protein [Mucilaginibacter rivuli]MBW4888666.1 hypothetical protein [Mucilaginibacter rivuli]